MFIRLIVLFLIFLSCYLWKQKAHYLLHWKLKGPLGYPFIGIIFKLRNKETYFKEIEKLVDTYGSPFVTWIGPKCLLFCSDPDTIETLLKSPNCVDKNSIYEFLHDLIGDGLFTTNGSLWNYRSKIMKPAFKRKPLSNFYSTFNREANVFTKQIYIDKDLADGSKLFNFMQLMTLRVTYQTTLALDSKDAETNFQSILRPFQILTQSFIDRIYQPLFHNRFFYQLTSHWKYSKKVGDDLHHLIEQEIKNKYIKMQNNNTDLSDDSGVELPDCSLQKNNFNDKSFVEYILARKNSNKLDFPDIRSEIETLISGGFETTAVVMFTTIIFLSMFPEEQEKLFEDLQVQFPYKDDFYIDEDDCKNKLIYMEMCINEAMRVVAPVPAVGRIASADIKLNNGVIVPKGTELIIDVYTMQRNTKYWGDNAKKFNPENFRPNNYTNKNPYAFIPFTKGLRMCIGFQYAYILMKIFLAKLFRNYKITTDMKYEDLIFVNSISIKYKNYPIFKIEKREY